MRQIGGKKVQEQGSRIRDRFGPAECHILVSIRLRRDRYVRVTDDCESMRSWSSNSSLAPCWWSVPRIVRRRSLKTG